MMGVSEAPSNVPSYTLNRVGRSDYASHAA